MNNQYSSNAEAYIKKNRLRRRIMSLTLVLALVVGLTTNYILKNNGQAMTRQLKVLNCTYTVHEHDENCKNEKGEFICGQANYVVHIHNDDCYANGELVCPLKEKAEHKHTENCYETELVLVCELEEEEEHTHVASCYEEVKKLVCGELELHKHDAKCYDNEGNLICGHIELLEHVHMAECFIIEEEVVAEEEESEGQHEITPEENEVTEEYEDETVVAEDSSEIDDESSEGETSQEDSMAETDDSSMDSNQVETKTLLYEDEDVIIKIEYTDEANIPDGTEIAASLQDQDGTNMITYDISLIYEDEEIEPDATVKVMVSFINGQFADQENLGVLHYEEGKEEASEIEDNTFENDHKGTVVVTFYTDSFSEYQFYGVVPGIVNRASFSFYGADDDASTDPDYPLAGQSYILYNTRARQYVNTTKNGTGLRMVTAEYTGPTDGKVYTTPEAPLWTFEKAKTTAGVVYYYLYTMVNNTKMYLNIGNNSASVSASSKTAITLVADSGSKYALKTDSNIYLNDYASSSKAAGWTGNDAGSKFYLALPDIPEVSELMVKDDIITSGCLQPELTVELDISDYTYVWYKQTVGTGETPSENGWNQVERKRVTGTEYNIDTDGNWVNVALDEGYRTAGSDVYYKVELVDDEGNAIVVSDPFAVPYYGELQNGSFETPNYTNSTNQPSNADYKAAGGVWQTTGPKNGQDIEIIESTNSGASGSYKWYNGANSPYTNKDDGLTTNNRRNTVWAPDGTQFAELNCEAAGSLYQDVLTVPGTTLQWWLAHHARGNNQNGTAENDTMYLLIMSTEQAQKLDLSNNTAVMSVINNISRYPGAAYWKFTSDDQTWHFYRSDGKAENWIGSSSNQGPYTVPDGQYLTRFFFVAGSTASQNDTIGNFLDDVGFSYGMAPPTYGNGNLRITKTLKAPMTEAEKNAAVAHMTFTYKENGSSKTLNASDMTWSEVNGEWEGVYDLANKTAGTAYTQFTENTSNLNISGSNLRSYTWTDMAVSVSYYGDGSKASTGELAVHESTNGQAAVTIQEQKTVTIDLTNNYEIGFGDFTFTKAGEKQDGTYAGLIGAVFALYEDEACTSPISQMRSTTGGVIKFEALNFDTTYYLKEISAPSAYNADTTTVYNVSYNQTTKAWEIYNGDNLVANNTINNPRYSTKVTIVKVDQDGKALLGAEFSLEAKQLEDETEQFDPLTITMDSSNTFQTGDLSNGTYVLKETTVPMGYQDEVLNQEFEFTIAEGRMTQNSTNCSWITADRVNNRITVTNTLKLFGIKVIKVDNANNSLQLNGAKFDLYQLDENGSITNETVPQLPEGNYQKLNAESLISENGGVVSGLTELSYGTYYLVEAEAPAGYNKLVSAIKITVGMKNDNEGIFIDEQQGFVELGQDGTIAILKVSNTSGYQLPATGGAGTMMFMMIGIGLIICSAIGLLLIAMRKTMSGSHE